MADQSRYIVIPDRGGFRITNRRHPLDVEDTPKWLIELAYEHSGIRRNPVTSILVPHAFKVESDRSQTQVGLVSVYDFVHQIAKSLMADWKPGIPHDDERDDKRPPGHPWGGMTAWAVQQTEKAINKMVNAERKRLLEGIDQTVLNVQKKIFSAGFGYGDPMLMMSPELYRHQYIVKDILQFRAAAVAVLVCDKVVKKQQQLEALSDWKTLFSMTGESYRALNTTLSNLPGGVPPSLLCGLRDFMLPRPITDRLELMTTILTNEGYASRHARLCSLASSAQIKEALLRVSRHLHRDLSPRRLADVTVGLRFITDYPDPHPGNLVGLAERSIRWHRDQGAEQIERTIQQYGHAAIVARPPIALPDIPGVRFLATVGDLGAESEEMGHCIASYARHAVEGRCFLFHVDYEGERASVEVSPTGRVLQAHGPRNQPNAAAKWGSRVLGTWARGLWGR
jgi:hypothetical protein